MLKKYIIVLLICFLSITLFAFSPIKTIKPKEIKIENGTISYLDVNPNMTKTIVCLHGLFANKEQWDGFINEMSQYGFRVIALDLPGFGKSNGFKIKDYDLKHQVVLIHDFLSKLNITKYSLVGNSMGGDIAILYTEKYPKEVQTLFLVGGIQGVEGPNKKFRNAILNGINPLLPINFKEEKLMMKILFAPKYANKINMPFLKKFLIAGFTNVEYKRLIKIWDIDVLYFYNLNSKLTGQKLTVKVPTLIIWGREDNVFNVKGADILQNEIPGSIVYKLKNAGHTLQIFHYKEIAKRYNKFLKNYKGIEIF